MKLVDTWAGADASGLVRSIVNFGITGGERLLRFSHYYQFRAAGISFLESLNIITGWGCWDIVSGAPAPPSFGSPGGGHPHRLGSHQPNGKICFGAVSHVFFVRVGHKRGSLLVVVFIGQQLGNGNIVYS